MSKVKTWMTEHEGFIMMLLGIIGLTVLFATHQPKQDEIEPPPEPTVIMETSAAPVEPPISPTPIEPFVSIKPSLEPTTVPEPEPIPPRYGFTEDEIVLMARLLCGDKNIDGDGEYDIDFGNDERYDQISLVLCVVMNRVRCETGFPDNVTDVILANNGQVWQFSPVARWKGEPNVSDIALLRVREWCEAYDRYDLGVQSIPEDHLYFTGDGKENHSR